jgi:hypothetical protein
MPNTNLRQITDRLFEPDVCAQIVDGTMCSSEVIYNLAVLIADCESANDNSSSMTQRRLSKQLTALAGLMILILDGCGSGSAT